MTPDTTGDSDTTDTSKPSGTAGLAGQPHDPAPELGEDQIHDAHDAWCASYVHVWADLSRGDFDKAAVEKAADEHWQRSPSSHPVVVAATEFTKPQKKAG